MNRLIILLLFLQGSFVNAQNCSALFSYGAYFDKVEFYNQSTVSNAHYYWNFGDGCSSAFKNPVHTFPGYGKFYVTLYVHDTINGCSAYSDLWINITKAASNLPPCLPLMTDSFWISNPNYYVLKDHSTNCSGLIKRCVIGEGGGGCNDQANLGNFPLLFPSWISYADNVQGIEEIFVKTTPHNFTPAKNYNGCSANFEYSILYANDSAQKILFKAMSKSATSYTWAFTGFGDPIYAYGDSTSFYYTTNPNPGVPYYTESRVFLFAKFPNGCKDSMYQNVSIRHTSVTTVGLAENPLEKAEIKLYPNPATSKLSLEYKNGSIAAERADIQNVLGQRIKEFLRPDLRELDITELSPGAYFLTIRAGAYTKAFKFIKE